MKTSLQLSGIKNLMLLSASILFSAVMLTSCSKTDAPVLVTPALVNVVNASETAGPQDFYFDDNKLNTTPLAYGQSSGNFTVTANSTHIGQFKTASSTTLNYTFQVAYAPGQYYSIYYTDDKTTIGVQNDKAAPVSGKAKVRFVNLSTNVFSGVDFSLAGGAAIVSALPYQTFSDYFFVDAGSNFTCKITGASSVLLNIPANLQSGNIYTIYLSGTTNATETYHVVTEL